MEYDVYSASDNTHLGTIQVAESASRNVAQQKANKRYGHPLLKVKIKKKGVKTYETGGGVDKSKQVFGKNKEGVFELPYEVAIYVPSTQDVDKVISLNEMESRVKEVSEYLSNLFGGYTSTDTIGGFVASNGELVNEEVTKVTSFSQEADFKKHRENLLKQIGKWGKDWGQEAIGLEYEGDLFYVPQDYPLKKMKKGGKISSDYFTGELSFLNW